MKAQIKVAAVFFSLILCLTACDMVERKEAKSTEVKPTSNVADAAVRGLPQALNRVHAVASECADPSKRR